MDRLLRPREAAEMLACATSTIYKYCDKGILPAVKIPAIDAKGKKNTKHLTRVLESDLQDFIQKHRKQTP